MSKLKLKGPVVGATVYNDGDLVAKDVGITLPAVTSKTFDFNAGGTTTLPVNGLTEAMEATITKIGEDLGLLSLIQPGALDLEVRWAEESVDNEGVKSVIGCRAYLKAHSKDIPGISIAVGEGSENALTFAVTRYQLIVDGKEFLLVDKLKGIHKINGTDLMSDVLNLL